MAKDHPTGESGLYSALLELKTPEECYRFLQDVCSYSELSAMEQRYNIAEMLVDKRIYTDDKAPDLSKPVLDKDYTVSAMFGEDALTGDIKLACVDANGTEITPDTTKVGKVIIHAGGLTAPNGNYTVVFVDGTLTIDERPVYTIKATAGIHGSITPSGDVDVLHGGSQTFTIAANRGYAISNVKIDGVSMLPLLEDPDAAPVRDALCLYYQDNSLEAVTDGTYKLIFPHDYLAYGTPGDDGMPGEMIPRRVEEKELYDMRRDPGERCNVLSQHPEIAEKLEAVAERYRAELGDDLTGCEGTGRRKPGYR